MISTSASLIEHARPYRFCSVKSEVCHDSEGVTSAGVGLRRRGLEREASVCICGGAARRASEVAVRVWFVEVLGERG